MSGKRPLAKATGTGLSRCAEVYAKALVNPFGDFDELPCVPNSPSVQSYRYRAFTRTQFSTNASSNFGFVAWVARNPASDQATLAVTNSFFSGSTITMAAAGVIANAKGGMQYPNASFSVPGGYRARLVGSGARFRCTSSEMNTAGSLQCVRANSQSSLTGLTYTGAGVNMANRKVTSYEALTEWQYWNWFPQGDADNTFPDAAVDYSAAVNLTPTMAIMASCPAGANMTYEVELVEFWELINTGQGAQLPALQRSHVDPVGMARVQEGVSVPPTSLDLRSLATHTSKQIIDEMAHSDSAAKTVEDLLGIAGLSIPSVAKLVTSLTSLLVQ